MCELCLLDFIVGVCGAYVALECGKVPLIRPIGLKSPTFEGLGDHSCDTRTSRHNVTSQARSSALEMLLECATSSARVIQLANYGNDIGVHECGQLCGVCLIRSFSELASKPLGLEDLINCHVRARMRGQWWHGSAHGRCRRLARKLRIDPAPTDGEIPVDSLITDLHTQIRMAEITRRMQTHLIRRVGPNMP